MSVPNLLPAAQVELTEAIDWYEATRPGLGVDFLGVHVRGAKGGHIKWRLTFPSEVGDP